MRPEARGSGVATRLVKDGASLAAERGHSHLVYWVGTENGRAVAFASGMGFRPTDYRRPMGVVSEEDGEEEIAMVLPLGDRTRADAAPPHHDLLGDGVRRARGRSLRGARRSVR